MIPGLAVSTLIGGAVLWGRVRPVDVPMVATWSHPVAVCGGAGVDPALLEEATARWRERGHDIAVSSFRCDVMVSTNRGLDDRTSTRDGAYLRGRTTVHHADGVISLAVVEVLPDPGVLALCHELGHALGYLHARSAPTGHVLHPHRPSLDDWRGVAVRLPDDTPGLPDGAELAGVGR